MKSFLLLIFFAVAITFTSCSQTNAKKNERQPKPATIVGDGCEGCEAVHESPVPFEKLLAVDTLPDFNEAGPKIEISGFIYKSDGRTPAPDVVLYVYHTDQAGLYSTKGNEAGWGKRHGYIRGWVKTDKNGFYKFYTLVPASYPNGKNPRHIHPTIKEQDKNEYWIDEYVFNDDPFLGTEEKNRPHPRGGNGVLKPEFKNGMLRASRNIILGLHVPGYPVAKKQNISSGLAIGEDCPAFDPLHLSGADKGKKACPMCKYGFGQGIMVWFNHNNLDGLKQFSKSLESQMQQRGEKNMRVFLIYMNPSYQSNDERGQKDLQAKIRKWCDEQNLQKLSVSWVPSPVDEETCGVFRINPGATNTVFIYKKRKVFAKWVNIDYDAQTLHTILERFDMPV